MEAEGWMRILKGTFSDVVGWGFSCGYGWGYDIGYNYDPKTKEILL